MKDKKNFSYKKNRLSQLKGFHYAARLRSVSEAAHVIGLTQSTITLQIQSLENDLKTKLFKRDTRPLSLTEAGEELYKKTSSIIGELESIIEDFSDYKNNKEKREIKIAVHHVAISYLMPNIIARFKKLHPQSKLTLQNISPSDMVNRLKSREVDLAFYPVYEQDPELEYIETCSYEPVLIINKQHPMSDKEIESLKDLKKFDLIRVDKNLITLPLFEEVFNSYKLGGTVEFENGNWDMLKKLVKKNDFAAVVSEVCLDDNDKDLSIKNLSKFFPKMTYAIVHKRGITMSEVVKDFVNIAANVSSSSATTIGDFNT